MAEFLQGMLIALLIMEVLYFLGKAIGVLPLLKVKSISSNARNGILFIYMNPRTFDLPESKGIYYQEEAEFKDRGPIIKQLFRGLLHKFVNFVVKKDIQDKIPTIFKYVCKFLQKRELLGQETEVQVYVHFTNHGKDPDVLETQHRKKQAEDLVGVYTEFKGRTVAKVVEDMLLYKNKAKQFIFEEHKRVDKNYDKLLNKRRNHR